MKKGVKIQKLREEVFLEIPKREQSFLVQYSFVYPEALGELKTESLMWNRRNIFVALNSIGSASLGSKLRELPNEREMSHF